jgi:DNA-binding NarL/FixJ family response regulator
MTPLSNEWLGTINNNERRKAMNHRILVVDDHPTVRESLQFVFAAAGMLPIVEATHCEEALHALRNQAIDVILLDVALHGQNGLDALREIKDFDASIPVLVHCHRDHPSLLWRSFHMGAAGYLVKGLDKNELLHAVRQAAVGAHVWTSEQLQEIGKVNEEYGEFEAAPAVAQVG